jgi:hypothetical protein
VVTRNPKLSELRREADTLAQGRDVMGPGLGEATEHTKYDPTQEKRNNGADLKEADSRFILCSHYEKTAHLQ